jgi:hypothetical protein
MASNPVSKLTEEQYLAIERAAEFKSEFLDGVMYAMSGGSPRHHRGRSRELLNYQQVAMASNPVSKLTEEQYLAIERAAEFKSEFLA